MQIPDEFADLRLPDGVQARLEWLLDKQDRGQLLSPEERSEAEGLVKVAELLTILRMRAERAANKDGSIAEARPSIDELVGGINVFVTSLERTDGFDERMIEHPTWNEVVDAISDIGRPDCESVFLHGPGPSILTIAGRSGEYVIEASIEGHTFLVVINKSNDRGKRVNFILAGDDFEVPDYQVCSKEMALTAAKEFYETGKCSNQFEWRSRNQIG